MTVLEIYGLVGVIFNYIALVACLLVRRKYKLHARISKKLLATTNKETPLDTDKDDKLEDVKELHFNFTIDKYAFILYNSAFLLFNLIYWISIFVSHI